MTTGIEWTDETWNPVRGCTRVSEGCRNCYAEDWAAKRLSAPGQAYHGLVERVGRGGRWTGKVACVEKVLEAPLAWRKPKRIFVNSMGDLFHEAVPEAFIDRVFAVMALAARHTFQILTKRPKRMREYLATPGRALQVAAAMRDLSALVEKRGRVAESLDWPLTNVWAGVSVEDQDAADLCIPILLETPAAVRFVSYEPALGPVDFRGFMLGFKAGNPANCAVCGHGHGFTRCSNYGGVSKGCHHRGCDCPGFKHKTGNGLDWIICGGESGDHARPMHPAWARAARDQCAAAGVPFFFKQWGAHQPVGPVGMGALAGPAPIDPATGRLIDMLAVKTVLGSVIARGPFAPVVDINGADWPRVDAGARDGMPAADDPWIMKRVSRAAAAHRLDGAVHDAMPECWKAAA